MEIGRCGFTLIELLIVVAIIGILAAIAIPNFLEAQVRAKVATIKANFTTLATGLECYYVDNERYVLAADELGFRHHADRLSHLTTPVAYLWDFPYDVFDMENTWSYWHDQYWYSDRWSPNDAPWVGCAPLDDICSPPVLRLAYHPIRDQKQGSGSV